MKEQRGFYSCFTTLSGEAQREHSLGTVYTYT